MPPRGVYKARQQENRNKPSRPSRPAQESRSDQREQERQERENARKALAQSKERARVALMRTLLAQPKALLLDEPFSKLDQKLRGKFRKQVFAYALKNRLPTLLVTHDHDDAEAAGGNILSL